MLRERAVAAVEGSEKSTCHEYKVLLENEISAKVTPAHDSAIYAFEYPSDKVGYLIIDVAHKLDVDSCMRNGLISIDPQAKRFFGGGTFFNALVNEKEWDTGWFCIAFFLVWCFQVFFSLFDKKSMVVYNKNRLEEELVLHGLCIQLGFYTGEL